LATHSGVSPEQFETEVRDWLTTAKHPRFNRPFTDLVYRPMLELIDLLKKNGFKVFIVSGGGIEFMRPWVEEVYGISKEHVIGSYLKMSYSNQENTPLILSLPEIEHINDKEGKVLGIQRHIGRKPIFVAGNSDGDLQMMQWADFQEGDQFILTVHHTDSVREWAYDRNSSIGRLDKVLEESVRNDWIQADIMNDWKYVYAFELAN
jgi:phosphoserine phosphatase